MKSKISFFNKTIFWKNVTLYWPIWSIYTFVCFIQQPIILWIINSTAKRFSGYTNEQRFGDLTTCLYFEPYIVIIAIGALVTGMALYSYMYNQKSANMIHALPVDRTQLYGTTLISGWAFLIVPLFATALFTTILCVVYGVPGILYVWGWFVCVAGIAFVAFSIVSICALFTGHIVVLPLYTYAVIYVSWIVYYLGYIIVTMFGFGVTMLSDNAEKIAQICCPPQCFYYNLKWIREYDEVGNFVGLRLTGGTLLILYTVLAVALYAAAYMIYRKRKIEQAGDFLTVNWVKPIFRCVITCVGGIFSAYIVREIFMSVGLGCGMPLFIILMLFIGAVYYFAADMFIKKSFHVFQKKGWIGCSIASVVLLIVFFGMYGLADSYEKYIPDLEDVKYAEIHMGYEIAMYGEDVSTIMDIQKDILEQADYIEEQLENGYRSYNMVAVRYYMKNGQSVIRQYPLFYDDARVAPVYKKILQLEQNKENFLVSLFGKDYASITTFYGGRFEAYFMNPEDRENKEFYPNSNYNSCNLEAAQMSEIYEAVIADIKAGTMMKYNIASNPGYYHYMEEENVADYFKNSEVFLSIEYQPYVSTNEYDTKRAAYLNMGPDCENTINKLVELGIIKSAEHIWWGQAEELLK